MKVVNSCEEKESKKEIQAGDLIIGTIFKAKGRNQTFLKVESASLRYYINLDDNNIVNKAVHCPDLWTVEKVYPNARVVLE